MPTNMDSATSQKLLQIRNELKNIRAQQTALKMSFKTEVERLQNWLRCLETRGSNGDQKKRLLAASSFSSASTSSFDSSSCSCALSAAGNSSSFTTAQPEIKPAIIPPSFQPIGHIQSMFKQKNGIPRQPRICAESRSKLTLSRQMFSNPHHLLDGLEGFSHVWIIFIFHQNNNCFNGAKVKPPRLDGAKVGVYATRSPYRPNPIGLTLAEVDLVKDGVIYLRGTDLLDGTPVIDIKPYIPEYDSVVDPRSSLPWQLSESGSDRLLSASPDDAAAGAGSVLMHPLEDVACNGNVFRRGSGEQTSGLKAAAVIGGEEGGKAVTGPAADDASVSSNQVQVGQTTMSHNLKNCHEAKDSEDVDHLNDDIIVKVTDAHEGEGQQFKDASYSPESRVADGSVVQVAEWVRRPPTPRLKVLFTPRASEQLEKFSCSAVDRCFKLCYFRTASEVQSAIESILGADPRSVYRRQKCRDRLYYMALDVVHVTAWFDGDVVEVVKVCPVFQTDKQADKQRDGPEISSVDEEGR